MAGRQLHAGSAKINITPPLSIPYLGYVPRQARFSGIHDPLFARALVLDNGDTKLAILAIDSLGFGNHILGEGRHFTTEVRQKVSERTDIEADHVMLASTHAHAAPETLGLTNLAEVPGMVTWLEVLMEQLTSAVEIAASQTIPVHLKLGIGQIDSIARNRRVSNLSIEDQIAEGLLDPQVGVLLCEGLEHDQCSVLINFACHPVTVQVQPLVSAGYPGVATDLVERTVEGCTSCLFLQGAAGNINPMRGDTRDFADVRRYGMSLAGEVLKVVGALQSPLTPCMEPILAVRTETLELPIRELPDPAPIQRAYEQAMESLSDTTTEQEKYQILRKTRAHREALDFIRSQVGPISGEVQVMRIGDLAVASTPGEMFVQLGLAIKHQSQAPYTFVVELANGWVGYLLNQGGFAQGGYEASPGPWTKVSEEAGQMLVNTSLQLISELWE